MVKQRPLRLTTVVVVVCGIFGANAHATQVDITNSNGTIPNQFMSSNGGLSSDDFAGTEANGVSVWLRARNRGDQAPVSRTGDTFKIREASGADEDKFAFEFQFSPRDGDTTNSNYFVRLNLDNDPSTGVNFGANTNEFFARVFDSDNNDELRDSGRASGSAADRSWDDGDSVAIDGVTSRDSGIVQFNNPTGSRSSNLPEYVVANSWLAEWDFSTFSLLGDDFGGAPGPGFYDIALTAFEDNSGSVGNALASTQITAQVGNPTSVPIPQTSFLLVSGLAGLALVWQNRKVSPVPQR